MSAETIIKDDKKVTNAWAMYDWANSVYALVISTAIFPIFYEEVANHFTKVINGVEVSYVRFFGREFVNTELYSYVVSVSFIIVALSSPLLSGIADYSGKRKLMLRLYCLLGALSCGSLYFFDINAFELSMFPVLLASIGYWGSIVFYNSYLPQIASKENQDKLSAKGYALGYIGGAVLMIINLIMIQVLHIPAIYSFVTVGLWWWGFAQWTYAYLPKDKKPLNMDKRMIYSGFKELLKVHREFKNLEGVQRYLLAFFVFSMGVQTVMLMATFFGTKAILWENPAHKQTGLIMSILLIQFIAIPGAYFMAWLSKKIGNINTLSIILVFWICICLGAYFVVKLPVHFYITACGVGFVMGGVQSLSRSTYSKMLPENNDPTSYFSFYDVVEKVGIVVGTFSFGFFEGLTGDIRQSVLPVIVFFVLGFILLRRVPKLKNETI